MNNYVHAMDRAILEADGKATGKSQYGICKDMEWKEYNYKGDRFLVSQFNDEVQKVDRLYCESCGKAFLPSRITTVHGIYECKGCASKY